MLTRQTGPHARRGCRRGALNWQTWRRHLSSRGVTACCAAQADAKPVWSPANWQDSVIPFEPHGLEQVTASGSTPPVVILPGFGNQSDDYVAPFGDREAGIVQALERRGFNASVVQVERKDWIRVARGILSLGYWRMNLTTHPGYSWYLQRVHTAVQAAREATGSSQVILVGHSAGGWLGRAFLGDPQWFPESLPSDHAPVAGQVSMEPNPAVRMMVTLGSPQQPPLPGKGRDMTGGAVSWVSTEFPGARYADDGVGYVCVCGQSVMGRRRRLREAVPTPPNYAFNAYREVCGRGGGVVGDAVVPMRSAFLEGATNVTLPGVFHSMSRLGTYNAISDYRWYGSDDVVDSWLSVVKAQVDASPVPA